MSLVGLRFRVTVRVIGLGTRRAMMISEAGPVSVRGQMSHIRSPVGSDYSVPSYVMKHGDDPRH